MNELPTYIFSGFAKHVTCATFRQCGKNVDTYTVKQTSQKSVCGD